MALFSFHVNLHLMFLDEPTRGALPQNKASNFECTPISANDSRKKVWWSMGQPTPDSKTLSKVSQKKASDIKVLDILYSLLLSDLRLGTSLA